jgi:colicin import membrane protein
MQTEQLPVVTTPALLVKALSDSGLSQAENDALFNAFLPHYATAITLMNESESVIVTDPTQVTEIRQSSELRKKLKATRVAADKLRADLKEESLRRGKSIQNVYNALAEKIEAEEERLMQQEKIAERMEAARKAKLSAERADALRLYTDPAHYALGDMTQAAFDDLLSGAKTAHENRIAAERKAAEERAAAEQARREEEARVRAENERLRKEAAEREAAARAERERLEAERREVERKAREEKAAAEAAARAERKKLEAEARRQREEAEAKARAEREAAEAKARKEREVQEKRHKAELARKDKIAKGGERLLEAVNAAAKSATFGISTVTVNRAEWDALIAVAKELAE